jgi:hypothetical protein
MLRNVVLVCMTLDEAKDITKRTHRSVTDGILKLINLGAAANTTKCNLMYAVWDGGDGARAIEAAGRHAFIRELDTLSQHTGALTLDKQMQSSLHCCDAVASLSEEGELRSVELAGWALDAGAALNAVKGRSFDSHNEKTALHSGFTRAEVAACFDGTHITHYVPMAFTATNLRILKLHQYKDQGIVKLPLIAGGEPRLVFHENFHVEHRAAMAILVELFALLSKLQASDRDKTAVTRLQQLCAHFVKRRTQHVHPYVARGRVEVANFTIGEAGRLLRECPDEVVACMPMQIQAHIRLLLRSHLSANAIYM